jgi:heme exporter protein A
MPVHALTLTATQLICSRDEKSLFKPVSFHLESGIGLVINGPNGIGKTTLLRVLAGLLPPLGGKIICSVPLQQQLAYLGPHNGVKSLLTPLEYLHYFTNSEGHEVLAQWGLIDLKNQPCGQLSSGQKQRLALSRVMAANASIWILDEPLTALDKQGETIFNAVLDRHLIAGGIAVIASHQELANKNFQKISLEI